MNPSPPILILTVLVAFGPSVRAGDAAPPSAEEVGKSPTLKAIIERDRIVVGSASRFKGFNTTNVETGQHEGFMVDIGKALAKRILGDENKVEWRYVAGKAHESYVRFVARGDVDLMIDVAAENPAAKKIVAFSDPIYDSGSALLVRRGSPIHSIDDIGAGTRVVHGMSDVSYLMLQEKHPGAKFIQFEDVREAFALLKAGEGDLFVELCPQVYNLSFVDPEFVVVGRFTEKSYGITVRKGDPVLLNYLNAFIREMKASGEYQALLRKWFLPHDGVRSPVLDAIVARDRVIVGNSLKFPVLNAKDPATGKYEGYMADVARAFARWMLGSGEKIEWRATGPSQGTGEVASGEVDLVIDSVDLGLHGERDRTVDFSAEILRSGSALLVSRDSPIRSIDDIRNSTKILLVQGDIADPRHWIGERAPGATYIECADRDEAFRKLKSGEGDVLSDTLPSLYDLASRDPKYLITGRYTERRNVIFLKKGDTVLQQTVNKFIQDFTESGAEQRLYQKWFAPYGLNGVVMVE